VQAAVCRCNVSVWDIWHSDRLSYDYGSRSPSLEISRVGIRLSSRARRKARGNKAATATRLPFDG
jgi:hypothetical protein